MIRVLDTSCEHGYPWAVGEKRFLRVWPRQSVLRCPCVLFIVIAKPISWGNFNLLNHWNERSVKIIGIWFLSRALFPDFPRGRNVFFGMKSGLYVTFRPSNNPYAKNYAIILLRFVGKRRRNERTSKRIFIFIIIIMRIYINNKIMLWQIKLSIYLIYH